LWFNFLFLFAIFSRLINFFLFTFFQPLLSQSLCAIYHLSTSGRRRRKCQGSGSRWHDSTIPTGGGVHFAEFLELGTQLFGAVVAGVGGGWATFNFFF
jgi:hypothetical protein